MSTILRRSDVVLYEELPAVLFGCSPRLVSCRKDPGKSEGAHHAWLAVKLGKPYARVARL